MHTKDIELGHPPAPHAKDVPGTPDAIEVRFSDDPAKLFGWMKGLVAVGGLRGGLRGAQVYPFNLSGIDELGCMKAGQTMIATDVIETCHILDSHVIEAYGKSGRVSPFDRPYPFYGTSGELTHHAQDLKARVVRWRYLPLTMDLYEQLFDFPDFVPIGDTGVEVVKDLQWVCGEDVGKVAFLPGAVPTGGKATSFGSLLKPATKAPLPFAPSTVLDKWSVEQFYVESKGVLPDAIGSVTGSLDRSDVYSDYGGAVTTTIDHAPPEFSMTAETLAKRLVDRMTADKERRLAQILNLGR